MAKKKVRTMTRSSKRRLVILGTVSVVLFAFFCVNVYQYTTKIITLSNQEKELTNKLNDLKEEQENLSVEIEKLHDPDYLANYARENYLYSKDGEYVLKIDDTEEKINEVHNQGSRYKIAIFSSLTVLGLLIFIIFKRH